MLKFLTIVMIAASTQCILTDDAAKKNAEQVAAVARMLAGSYSSQEQSKEDATFFDVRLHMTPLWPERAGEHWLYVEQAMANALEKPYRQRVCRLEWVKDAVVSRVYSLPGDPLKFAGGHEKPERLTNLKPDQLVEKAGCAITLKSIGKDKFAGSTDGKSCASDLRGATYATSEVTLTPTLLTSWDRGFDANGKQVWGAVTGPYKFKKLSKER